MTDCSPSAPDRESFKNFSHQNKQGDDEGREDFTDRQGRHDSDGHGKLHRHAALNDIFVGFVEYRETTYESTNYTDTSHVGIPGASEKPNPCCRGRHKQDAADLPPIQRMLVLVTV